MARANMYEDTMVRYDAMIDLLRENLEQARKTNELLGQLIASLNKSAA
jgi:hypothetical protein